MSKGFQAGIYKQQKQYTSFSPSFINLDYKWQDPVINTLLEEAGMALGGLNSYITLIPNFDFFVHMHLVKEATESSKIEGTKTTIDEAVQMQEDIDPERRDDWQEVQNYTQAMESAVAELDNLPLSMRLLKEAHKILLKGVRGKYKAPGEIRKTQNWIGGSNLTDAIFIPPHQDELVELLSDLEKYIHNDTLATPHLIKIAILHYQFETIHPFLDGNGRLGRLLIILYLVDKGLLKKPILYLSSFFEKNRTSYYDSLTLVRTMNSLDQWIKFFLNGIKSAAIESSNTLNKIIILQKQCKTKIAQSNKKAKNMTRLLELFLSHPIMNYDLAKEKLGLLLISFYRT
jgi:Fic family protein